MTRGNFFICRLPRCALAALVFGCALAPGSALAAQSAAAAAKDLSPRLAELAQPPLRTASPAEQAEQLSLAADGPGSLLRRGNRLLADVRFDRGAAESLAALRDAGAQIVHLSGRYQVVTVAARPAELPAIAAVAGVDGVTEVLAPAVRGADCGGAVRSEGDAHLNAVTARPSFGVDGSGVTVGILSDSFDRDATAVTHAAGDVATGDLPGPGSPCGSTAPVGVLDDSEPLGADEGRAMAQIVRDLAPGASIAFAGAFAGETAFADNIRALAQAGAKVIVDDVGYFEEPFFQDGPVAVAIGEVTAAGVSYFSAAGNDNVIAAGKEVASYEAPFRDAGSCPVGVPPGEGTHCADFNPGPGVDNAYDMTVAPGGEVLLDLQWAEPWFGVKTDLDAYLLDGSGNVLASSANRNVANTQVPFEFLHWENEDPTATVTVRLAIPRFAGTAAPRLKFIQLGNGSTVVGPTEAQYNLSAAGDVLGPAIYGHSGAAAAISVGAVRYNALIKAESFSSRGPVRHFYGPVAGTAPAAPAEATIAKPDLAATDCGVTTFFFRPEPTSPPPFRFCGTSASAPHAAAVAALMRQANPGASGSQVRSALAATASPVGTMAVGTMEPNVVGAGLVNAYAAVDALALPPVVRITQGPEPLSRNRRPTIQFSANRPVAFTCEVDGVSQPCASPFTLPVALADGKHGVAVRGADVSGRAGGSGVIAFAVDTRAPRTFFAKHPRKLIRTHRRRAKATFRFGSNEAGVAFICKVDRDLLRYCAKRVSRRFDEGRHVVVVKSRDAAGNFDATPAVFKFQVKRVGAGGRAAGAEPLLHLPKLWVHAASTAQSTSLGSVRRPGFGPERGGGEGAERLALFCRPQSRTCPVRPQKS